MPWRYPGAGRRVYPGFVQLTAFMSMNLDRHINAHIAQFRALAGGDIEAARRNARFYDEYFAVWICRRSSIWKRCSGCSRTTSAARQADLARPAVHPAAIRRTALLTVEGERDDICAIGQTMAALDLCTGVRVDMKRTICRPASAIMASSAAAAGSVRFTLKSVR